MSCTVFRDIASDRSTSLHLATPLVFNSPDGGVPLGSVGSAHCSVFRLIVYATHAGAALLVTFCRRFDIRRFRLSPFWSVAVLTIDRGLYGVYSYSM